MYLDVSFGKCSVATCQAHGNLSNSSLGCAEDSQDEVAGSWAATTSFRTGGALLQRLHDFAEGQKGRGRIKFYVGR